MAVENDLLVLIFGALNILGFEVWFQNGCGLDRCFPNVFGIVAKFPRRKSNSISPYFRGGNPTALHLKSVIACKKLFSPSFQNENTKMGIPYFHGKNLAEFRVSAHQQGFLPMYTARANVLVLRWARAPQSTWHIHGETDFTWWHESWQSPHGDNTHSMTQICTYSNRLKHILMPQGQEHSWPERMTHVTIRIHHTKCTITRRHTHMHTHTHM